MVLLIIAAGVLLFAVMSALSFWLAFEMFGCPHIPAIRPFVENELKIYEASE